jgi:diguanylate cyclase (GGDEF)-like protein
VDVPTYDFDSRSARTGAPMRPALPAFEDLYSRITGEAAPLTSAQRRLAYLATHDQLTGLANRTLLHWTLDVALDRMRSANESLALMFIDLDGFKSVNDRFGHQAGDDVLRRVADRLASVVRATDVIGRFGGDEFVVVCHGLVDADVAALAKRLNGAARNAAHAVGVDFARRSDVEINFTGCSIGVAVPTSATTPASLLDAADSAMFQAKRSSVDFVITVDHGPVRC